MGGLGAHQTQGVFIDRDKSTCVKFECVKECSQCCIEREYYPSKRFGKIGVLILPEEKSRVERLAESDGTRISILPRIGISKDVDSGPTKILAYQMMGVEENGNTCPFLDTDSKNRSPHGGFPCRIYSERPLACRAYPLIESKPITLDEKCKFCKECRTADQNLDSETESLLEIKEKMNTDPSLVWRFATGVGETEDKDVLESGWILEQSRD